MTKPLVTYHDPERATVDLLAAAMSGVTVGVNLPEDWTPKSTPHIQVAWNGTPTVRHPISMAAVIRLIAYAGTKTDAKRLAMEAQGRACAYSSDQTDIVSILPLTGPLPASDPDHHDAEICAVTVRVTVASTPIT